MKGKSLDSCAIVISQQSKLLIYFSASDMERKKTPKKRSFAFSVWA